METKKAQQILDDNNIYYTIKNNGTQLIVEGYDCYIDYYPSTGLWKTRNNTIKGFGLRGLITYCLTGVMPNV